MKNLRENVIKKVDDLSEYLQLYYASPNRGLVVEVMQLDAGQFDSLANNTLSKYILVLGQYLVMLQHNENMKGIEHMILSKSFDYNVSVKKISAEIPKSLKTEKEKLYWIIQNDSEIEKMYEDLIAAEAEKMLTADMAKAIENLLNALKKEKSTRTPEQ